MHEFWHAPAITRARVKAVDDSGDHQTIDFTGHDGEEFTKVLRLQNHGFTSNPPDDSYGYFMRMGESDRLVALGFENKNRPKNLPRGAKAIYDQHGKVLKFVETKTDLDGGDKDFRQRKVKKVQLDADTEYWIKPAPGASIFLGAQGPFFPVLTQGGASQHVYAAIGPAGPNVPEGVE
jgi:phage gp45-like